MGDSFVILRGRFAQNLKKILFIILRKYARKSFGFSWNWDCRGRAPSP